MDVEIEMKILQDFIVTVRALRKDHGVAEKQAVGVKVAPIENAGSVIKKNQESICRMAKISRIDFVSGPITGGLSRSTTLFDVALDYEKPINAPAERERLAKDLAKYEKEMQSKQSQLQNDAFLAKAPEKVVAGLRTRAEELTVLLEKTRSALDALDAVGSR